MLKEDVEEDAIEDAKEDAEVAAVTENDDDCLVLEGDNDENVLVVNSETELIPSLPSQTPKFEIVSTEDAG